MIESAARPRWWVDIVLLAAFIGLTVVLINGHLLDLDERVADWAFSHQPRPAHLTARFFNNLGQGGWFLMPVTILLSGFLFARTRSIRAFLPFVAAFVILYATVGPVKIWAGRAAPHFTGPDRAIMFNPAASGAKALSYPSGHMANSLVWYFTMAVLVTALIHRQLTRREQFAIRFLPPAILFCTTIYLGFHWLTDSVAGLLIGLVLARVLARVRWDALPLPYLKKWNGPAGV